MTPDATPSNEIEVLRKRVERERAARKEAERLLEEKSRELYEANVSLETRVRDRTEDLESANRRLAEAAAARTRFLADVSHEIRTPLNGVVGLAESLENLALPPEAEGTVASLRSCAQDLTRLINDFLDFGRLEAGRTRLDPRPVDLFEEVCRAAELFRPAAETKGLSFRVKVGHPRVVYLDDLRLRQIVANLVGNALKFTPAGVIEVIASHQGDRATVSVRDTGIGIPPDRLEKVWETYGQAEDSTTRRFGGTGLGLAIVRSLARLMQGDAHAESELGRGSCFTVEFAAPVAEAVPRVERSSPNLGGVRVLVVDDVPLNLRVTEAALRSAGCEPTLVASGEEALATDLQFDVVLTDIRMPGMDGYDLSRRLRERGFDRPVLAITASALDEDRRLALSAGMDGLLAKPFTRESLRLTLASVLQRGSENTARGVRGRSAGHLA